MPDANYIKQISCDRANDEPEYATLPGKFHLPKLSFQSTSATHNFVFKLTKETQVQGKLITVVKKGNLIVMEVLYWWKKKHNLHFKLERTKFQGYPAIFLLQSFIQSLVLEPF